MDGRVFPKSGGKIYIFYVKSTKTPKNPIRGTNINTIHQHVRYLIKYVFILNFKIIQIYLSCIDIPTHINTNAILSISHGEICVLNKLLVGFM